MQNKDNQWTREEIEYLTENYNLLTMEKMMRKLPRHTKNGIRHKARMLGVTRVNHKQADYYDPRYKNMTVAEQAKAMGVSYHTVYQTTIYGKRKTKFARNK